MSADALLCRALEAGIELWVEDQKLRFRAPQGVLDAPLRADLQAAREELTTRLADGAHRLPLSAAQERMWLADRMQPGNAAYNIPFAVLSIRGPLDVEALKGTLDELLNRHDALRASFTSCNGVPMQVVPRRLEMPFTMASGLEPGPWAVSEMQRPFDLLTGPPIRAALLKLDVDTHWLAVTMHHIAADVWSMQAFVRDLAAAYRARTNGQPSLPPLPLGFGDALLHKRRAESAAAQAGRAAWKARLEGAPLALQLPGDRARPAAPTFRGSHASASLGLPLTEAVKERARAEGATPFVVLLAACAAWLAQLTGQDDLVIGCPVAGRNRAGTENLVGLFADTLPLRCATAGDPSFGELVSRLRATVLEALAADEVVPLARILETVQEERASARTPLIQVLFDVLAEEPDFALDLGSGVSMRRTDVERGRTDVDLFLVIHEGPDGFHVWVEYACDLFDAATVERWLARYVALLATAVAAPTKRLSDLPSRAPEESTNIDTKANRALLTLLTDAAVTRVRLEDPVDREVALGMTGELILESDAGPIRPGWAARTTATGGLDVEGTTGRRAFVRGVPVDLPAIERSLLRAGCADAYAAARERDVVCWVVPAGPLPARAALENKIEQELGLPFRLTLVPVARLPLDSRGAVDIAQLDEVPVIDESVLSEATQAVRAEGGGAVRTVEALHAPASIAKAALGGLRVTKPAPAAPTRRTEPALVDGGLLPQDDRAPRTLSDILSHAAAEGRGEVVYAQDGATEQEDFAALQRRASCVASGLRERGVRVGDRVLLLVDDPAEVLAAFWGCVWAGAVPAVAPSLAPGDTAAGERRSRIHARLGGPLVIHSGTSERELKAVYADLADLTRATPLAEPHRAAPEDVAFLALTSGSTGLPKAIRLTHRGLIDRARGAALLCCDQRDDVVLNWLPFDHVASLADWHLRPLLSGARCVYARTGSVLSDPLRWLDLIEAHRVTRSWAPNFAFGVLAEAVGQASDRRWDLTCVRTLLCAGESISLATLLRLRRLLARHGLAVDALEPAFGMAELGSGVTYVEPLRRAQLAHHRVGRWTVGAPVAEDPSGPAFVELGPPIPGVSLRVVSAEGALLSEREAGRVQVRGGAVCDGSEGDATPYVDAGGWFDTGDIGFLDGGRLVLTGREKDTLVINGANWSAAEIESSVARVPGVKPGEIAAFGVRGLVGEELALAFVPAERSAVEIVARALRETLRAATGLSIARIVTVDAIPRTGIGKARRGELARLLDEGVLGSAIGAEEALTIPAMFHRRVWSLRTCPPPALLASGACVLVSGGGPNAGTLAEALSAGGYRVVTTLEKDCWPALVIDTSSCEGPDSVEPARAWDLLTLYQALGAVRPEGATTRLLVATTRAAATHTGEPCDPARAAIGALVQTLSQEAPWLDARHADFDTPTATRIAREAFVGGAIEREVAWRGDSRYVARLESVAADEMSLATPRFQQGGIYLITGGASGVGLLLARMLRERYAARVALVGRTPQIEALDALDGLPGQAILVAADVTDSASLRAATAHASEALGGEIQGFIHCAGAYSEELLAHVTLPTLQSAWAARVNGLAHLLEIAEGRLVIAAASLTSLAGGVLVGAYAAACRAAEALAAQRTNLHVLAYGAWRGVGISRQFDRADVLKARGIVPMSSELGIVATLAASGLGPGVVLVGLEPTGRLARRLGAGPLALQELAARGLPLDLRLTVKDAAGRNIAVRIEEGEVAPVLPLTALEAQVAAVWGAVLGRTDIQRDDNFFDLGGTSVLAFQVLRRLQDAVAREIAIVDLFRHPTVQSLAEFLGGASNAPAPDAALARARSRRLETARQREQRMVRR